ncbi:terpenoid synthase [Rhizopogon vinicolor AM-OR11-026]|uniref:Terpenoid synthase n=1 Tax=Rhizopogon vinicolor AM-OR11-026 TaxID=1314800 RepID=A0A1B7N0E1_9AGAM|nr:terpenoid synthase [Rhizopogon vinicolor AM-OR11-026]
MFGLLLTHPHEFRTLVCFYVYHETKRDITAQQEHPTSGWDRASMRRCWEFLDNTSRSFAAVIKELDGDLARTICMYYLVLRGLDTIEDDMTIPDEKKQLILRNFHDFTKDQQLLHKYHIVVEEVNRLVPQYKTVILDISSGKETPWLCDQLELANSMGLLLQKTNIIRDFREDSSMVLDALKHACDSLDYLRLLKNQSMFVFCAVPVSMAMATLTLCFMNPKMFQRNIKIRKAEAVHLIMRSTNTREVLALIFRKYARKIHHKAKPHDPNFLKISAMCCKIQQWYEQNYSFRE